MIDELRDHITVRGYGRVGRRVPEAPDLNFELMFARRTSLLECCGV